MIQADSETAAGVQGTGASLGSTAKLVSRGGSLPLSRLSDDPALSTELLYAALNLVVTRSKTVPDQPDRSQ